MLRIVVQAVFYAESYEEVADTLLGASAINWTTLQQTPINPNAQGEYLASEIEGSI